LGLVVEIRELTHFHIILNALTMKKLLFFIVAFSVVVAATAFFEPDPKDAFFSGTPVVVTPEGYWVSAGPQYPCRVASVSGIVRILKNKKKVTLKSGMTISNINNIIFSRTSNKVEIIDHIQNTYWVLPEFSNTIPPVACTNNCKPLAIPHTVNDTVDMLLPGSGELPGFMRGNDK
jgi:hypothetical protein